MNDAPRSASPRRRLITRVLVAFIALATVLGLVELVAQAVWKHKYNQWLDGQLHGYDHVDQERSIIVPTPGTVVTVDRHRADLARQGKPLGLRDFEKSLSAEPPPDSLVLFRVNRLGFKGPEIDMPKPDGVFRILTIGDSCTWLPARDRLTYPRTMERELNRLLDERTTVEVVNGAVLGYNFERAIKRIDEYMAVDPDLVTIYLGWNRTIGRADPAKHLGLYRRSALYRIYYHFVQNRTDTGLTAEFQPETYFDPVDPALAGYREYRFDYDMRDLESLVDAIRARDSETRVAVITLAGILDRRVEPDAKAIEVSYPIASTDNLYAWPLLTSRFNDALRALAARHPDIILIDFEAHALEHFVPRSAHFEDSVHPSNVGYRKMGVFLARELLEPLRRALATGAPGEAGRTPGTPARDGAPTSPARQGARAVDKSDNMS